MTVFRSALVSTALSVMVLGPLPVNAQDTTGAQKEVSKKDQKKAAALVKGNAVFERLPDVEKSAVIKRLGFKEDTTAEEITKAKVHVIDGETLAAIDKKISESAAYKRCDVVVSREVCVTGAPPPPTVLWVPFLYEMEPFGGLYKDNEYEFDEGSAETDSRGKTFTQALDDMISTLDAKKAAAAQGGENFQWRISSIHIEARASTLKNKDPKMTHLHLSQLRAEGAEAFLKKYLAAKSVAVPDDAKIIKDFKGDLGNGTAGPSSPFSCPSCPKGDGPPPSKETMLKYLNSQAEKGESVSAEDVAAEQPAGLPAGAAAAPGAVKSKVLDELKAGAGGAAKPGADAPAPTCAVGPPLSMADLYRAYYDQFKYVRVSFTIDGSREVASQEAAAKKCTAHAVLVGVSTNHPDETRIRHRHKTYVWRRIGHFFKCLVDVKKDPCHPFSCGYFF